MARASSGLGSVSLVSTLPVTGILISVTLISSSASGALSNTLTVMVAVSVLPLPSSTVYGICTLPTKSSAGVKIASPVNGSTVRVPAVFPVSGSTIVTEPADGSCPLTSAMIRESASGSVSFANKFAVAGSFLVPAIRSSPAFGLLLLLGSSGATFRVTDAASVAPLGSTMV